MTKQQVATAVKQEIALANEQLKENKDHVSFTQGFLYALTSILPALEGPDVDPAQEEVPTP